MTTSAPRGITRACRARFGVVGRAVVTACLSLALGCTALKPMVVPPSDLADYRSFRVAAAEGTRLARAKKYLDAHPQGAFADEVRAAFEEEEPRYFARAQQSRQNALDYLSDLPDGPHAVAALALVNALASTLEDAELRDVARRARSDDARLEEASVHRRAVGEAILGAVGALLDDHVYGEPRRDAPPALRKILQRPPQPTWGAVPDHREDDYFFLLPTQPKPESRLVTLRIGVVEKDDVVVEGTIEAADMLVQWMEADTIQRLDASSNEDRRRAQAHAMDRLLGALERRLPSDGSPASRDCRDLRSGNELYHRSCGGWEAWVVPGSRAGEVDRIGLRGPKTPS